VLVLGAGPIGLAATFWARQLGAERVVVAASSDRRQSFASEMGATAFATLGDTLESDVAAMLGGPPDVVLECAGMPGALMQAMELVRPKGTIVGMGYGLHAEPIETAVPLFKELRLLSLRATRINDEAMRQKAYRLMTEFAKTVRPDGDRALRRGARVRQARRCGVAARARGSPR